MSLKPRIVEGRKRGCSDLKEFGETDNFSNSVFFSLPFFKGKEGEDRTKKVGADEMKNIPFGAVAIAGYVDKLSCGLQQLMAGVRKFNLSEITRE